MRRDYWTHALATFLTILFLGVLACDILSPEDDPWLRVWWVPMEEVQPGEVGLYLRAYAQPDEELTWGFIQEWSQGLIEWEGTVDPGLVLQLPISFQEEIPMSIIFWAQTLTLGPDTIHYEHTPELAQSMK